MIKHFFAQGSIEWLYARAGIATASEFGNLVTPAKFERRDGEMFTTYLATKIAEKWLGPLPGFSSWDTEQGQLREEEAIPWLEFDRGIVAEKVGLVTTDDGLIGCSPDGLIGDDNGLEIKCPSPTVHVKYLLAGEAPAIYMPQVMGAMLVTGFPRWTFVSYARKLPPLVLEVKRDEKKIAKLREALEFFQCRFAQAMDLMTEKNGGVGPPKHVPPSGDGERVRFSWETAEDEVPS